MSNAPPEVRAEDAAGRPAGLTPDEIDRVLADFRGWLEDLSSGGRQPPVEGDEPGADAPRSPEPIDLHTLVAQYTALRHEVNLQTKATRAAVEQNARLIDSRPADDSLRPLVTAVVEIADALTAAHRRVEGTVGTATAAANAIKLPPATPDPAEGLGWFARLLGRPGYHPEFDESNIRLNHAREAVEKLRAQLSSVGDGYTLSLRRVERALPAFGLELIECVGRPFDPDTMEVVELGDGGPSGTVLEEVRRGYRWNGTVFRFAQVKVAR
jgi:molecular chaperone GrpE